jgi:hypothetical protein
MDWKILVKSTKIKIKKLIGSFLENIFSYHLENKRLKI